MLAPAGGLPASQSASSRDDLRKNAARAINRACTTGSLGDALAIARGSQSRQLLKNRNRSAARKVARDYCEELLQNNLTAVEALHIEIPAVPAPWPSTFVAAQPVEEEDDFRPSASVESADSPAEVADADGHDNAESPRPSAPACLAQAESPSVSISSRVGEVEMRWLTDPTSEALRSSDHHQDSQRPSVVQSPSQGLPEVETIAAAKAAATAAGAGEVPAESPAEEPAEVPTKEETCEESIEEMLAFEAAGGRGVDGDTMTRDAKHGDVGLAEDIDMARLCQCGNILLDAEEQCATCDDKADRLDVSVSTIATDGKATLRSNTEDEEEGTGRIRLMSQRRPPSQAAIELGTWSVKLERPVGSLSLWGFKATCYHKEIEDRYCFDIGTMCRDALLVSEVFDTGILATWNTQHPEAAVRARDLIVAVNGATGAPPAGGVGELLAQLDTRLVDMRLVRPPPLLDVHLVQEGQGLGFEFRGRKDPRSDGASCVRIVEVTGDGALAKYNASCASEGRFERFVLPGMSIVNVNRVSDRPSLMCKQLQEAEVLQLLISTVLEEPSLEDILANSCSTTVGLGCLTPRASATAIDGADASFSSMAAAASAPCTSKSVSAAILPPRSPPPVGGPKRRGSGVGGSRPSWDAALPATAEALDVPPRLTVCTPNGQEACGGSYRRVEGLIANGMPVWHKEDSPGERYIYAGSNGMWLIANATVRPLEFNCNRGYIHWPYAHGGRLPHCLVGRWERASGQAWCADSEIVIAAAATTANATEARAPG
eukprot:TRINITY_DN29501_c0_g1_i1.p1 TRINITY_DN29501_c0_g1~~TRINITY_DN29501_c0_g1_i1.p1  ORF type:complete len:799 (-),score=168.72 TRINITY_DN29501_c0_g1_i1:12-2330(-)